MIARADCQLIGRWRIIKADLWDRDNLDLAEPAHLEVSHNGWAEFTFGALTAGGQIDFSQTSVFSLARGSTKAMRYPARRRLNQ
jgi:hypothetical protein